MPVPRRIGLIKLHDRETVAAAAAAVRAPSPLFAYLRSVAVWEQRVGTAETWEHCQASRDTVGIAREALDVGTRIYIHFIRGDIKVRACVG